MILSAQNCGCGNHPVRLKENEIMTDLKSIKILIPGKFHAHGLARLREIFTCIEWPDNDLSHATPEQLLDIRGMACSMIPVRASLIDALPNLEIIGNFGVGYDSTDAAHAATKNIIVTNTPDVLDDEVADTAIGLLINTLRELPKAEAYLRCGDWVKKGSYPLSPLTLRGRTIGIIGMGRIGSAIAKRLEGFGVTIHYHNRRRVEGSPYYYQSSLLELAQVVDTVISVMPATPETLKICGADFFKALGTNGVFINIGRGTTVDEDALATALSSGIIAAAGLDVFADEPNVPKALLGLPNAVLLPHIASASVATRRAMADLVVDNVTGWFVSKKVLTPVPESLQILAP